MQSLFFLFPFSLKLLSMDTNRCLNHCAIKEREKKRDKESERMEIKKSSDKTILHGSVLNKYLHFNSIFFPFH